MNTTTKPKTKRKSVKKVIIKTPIIKQAFKVLATIAAAFLPIASYWIAHNELLNVSVMGVQEYIKAVLVLAALAYSAPTLAAWACNWTHCKIKAWGFTILLEGVMISSSTDWLAFTALAILATINAAIAFDKNN
jgi:hypothetical protein